jgi:hypothetical protein
MTRAASFASIGLFLALCAPALCGLVYTANDLGAFHLPLRAFYAQAIADGDSFDWCPHLFGGFYLTGEGQAGTYHPLHWVLYRFLPLALAWNLECLLSYPLLFAGMWLLARRHGMSAREGLFAAMLFTFCGFNLLHFVHVNAVAVVAHIPWLLVAINRLDEATRDRDRSAALRQMAVVALLTGSQLLIGYPQYVIYSVLAECLFVGTFCAWRIAPAWAVGKSLGSLLAAVQLLPTMEALADSVRQSADASFAGSGSLHPLNAMQLVAPYLFTTRVVGQNTHELTLYVGAAPLLLAVVAMRNCSKLAGFARGLVLVGGVLAMGNYSPLHRLLTALPAVGYFRFPCRATVLLELGIGLLAAIGMAAIYRVGSVDQTARDHKSSAEEQTAPLRLPHKTMALLLAGSVALSFAAPIFWHEYTAAAAWVWLGPVLLAVAYLLLHQAASGKRWALSALVLFAAIDLGAYGISYGAYCDATSLDAYIAQTPSSPYGGRVALDLLPARSEGLYAGNQVLMLGGSRIDGYAGLEPSRQLDYRRIEALRIAGVAAVWAEAPLERKRALRRHDHWLEVPDPFPRCRLMRSLVATDEPNAAIERVNLATTAVVSPEDKSLVRSHLAGGCQAGRAHQSVGILQDRPGHMVLSVDSSAPAIAVLTESYHRGWTGSIGGSSTTVLRVNGDFLGCLVPAGRSILEFRFIPASLRYGRLGSVFGLGFLGLLLAASRWRPFRRPMAH